MGLQISRKSSRHQGKIELDSPAPPIHHRPYATLVLPTSARLSPLWGNTTLCAAIVCDNTPRSIARIAQTRYALYATAISLRSIRLRHALLPRWGNTRICARLFRCAQYAVPAPLCAQSIVCTQSKALRALFYRPTVPTFPPLIAHAPKTCPHHDKF